MMTTMRWMTGGAAVAVLAACAGAMQQQQPPQQGHAAPRQFTVPLYNAGGTQVATAAFQEIGRDSVRVEVTATALPQGVHGTHLHAVGECEGPGYTTAGAHLNPANRQHGLRNPNGPHLGDLPNLVVGADGHGQMIAVVRGTLGPGQAPIFDQDGTSLIVHANADDEMTDPSGNSGARIGCGIVAAPSGRI